MTIFYIKLKVTDYSVFLGNSSVTCVSVATWKIPPSKNVNKTKAKTNKFKFCNDFQCYKSSQAGQYMKNKMMIIVKIRMSWIVRVMIKEMMPQQMRKKQLQIKFPSKLCEKGGKKTIEFTPLQIHTQQLLYHITQDTISLVVSEGQDAELLSLFHIIPYMRQTRLCHKFILPQVFGFHFIFVLK